MSRATRAGSQGICSPTVPSSARVAVLIPTFNRADMLREALESLKAQTEPCEVWVYDDGSTDHTADVVADYPVRYMRAENVGMTAAFNRGVAWILAESQAPFIAWLGSDDWYTPDSVELRSNLLTGTAADCVFSGITFVPGKPHHIHIGRYTRDFHTFQKNVATGTAMFRREKWIPWHEEIVTGGADLLWVYEMFCRGYEFAYEPTVTYRVRRHAGRQLYQRRAMDQAVVVRELEEHYWPLVKEIGA